METVFSVRAIHALKRLGITRLEDLKSMRQIPFPGNGVSECEWYEIHAYMKKRYRESKKQQGA